MKDNQPNLPACRLLTSSLIAGFLRLLTGAPFQVIHIPLSRTKRAASRAAPRAPAESPFGIT